MKLSRIRKGVVFAIASATLGLGCELIVDFDRTKIPVEGNDGAIVTPDATTDAPIDTSAPDTSTGVDAATDAADAAVTDAADASDSG